MIDCIPIFRELSCTTNRNLLTFAAVASFITVILFILIAVRKEKLIKNKGADK